MPINEGTTIASHLWITYIWADNDEDDFDHLVRLLNAGGIAANYDKIALVQGQRLLEQIAERISDASLAGWAYLVTPRSVDSQLCHEELAYALDRALNDRGEQFSLARYFGV